MCNNVVSHFLHYYYYKIFFKKNLVHIYDIITRFLRELCNYIQEPTVQTFELDCETLLYGL